MQPALAASTTHSILLKCALPLSGTPDSRLPGLQERRLNCSWCCLFPPSFSMNDLPPTLCASLSSMDDPTSCPVCPLFLLWRIHPLALRAKCSKRPTGSCSPPSALHAAACRLHNAALAAGAPVSPLVARHMSHAASRPAPARIPRAGLSSPGPWAASEPLLSPEMPTSSASSSTASRAGHASGSAGLPGKQDLIGCYPACGAHAGDSNGPGSSDGAVRDPGGGLSQKAAQGESGVQYGAVSQLALQGGVGADCQAACVEHTIPANTPPGWIHAAVQVPLGNQSTHSLANCTGSPRGDSNLDAPLLPLSASCSYESPWTADLYDPHRALWWRIVTEWLLPVVVVAVGVGCSAAGLWVSIRDLAEGVGRPDLHT